MNYTKALSLVNVNKIYKGGFHAVKDVSFDVYPGDFFALLGPNGAGKSTTLGMISALVNKTSGSIEVCGYDTLKSPFMARKHLGVMPQEVNLNIFETPMQILLTQAGYFGIDREATKPYAEKLLRDMALWDKKDEQVRFLSGGMKRRLMVARALIHKPKVLILDEPTAGVDVELRQSLWEQMRALNKEGLTIILTTHYLEEAESMCNRIALIHQGKLHTSSDMKTLLRSVEKETYIFDLKEPITPSQMQCEYGQCQLVDSNTLEIEVDKSVTLNQLFADLSQQNIDVLSVKTKTNKLEKLFIDVARNKA
ncbi:ABC transporter ATP-binding protein [Cysteiniphilum sp. QT6929]|uniref:ABC transporter ATP-binding protein n=1 Tax=Cysteiniphilum sp. QT6929 TaxID=2975055 RepID=UPI0024B34A6A|nr:ABC transporter ATP-binding protein [Cysteiniphilum sp. QT6929]WHN66073.1 ABC transporter ATP-binding protein [Cysteiniphilum sp. QT6929]